MKLKGGFITMILKHFTDEVIQSASDNSVGTLLNETAINLVVNSIIESRNLDKNYVDSLIAKNETESGYMTKFSDFNHTLKDFIIGNNLQQDFEPEKPEKDYEQIELMYGDWHAECGDR